MISRLEEYAGRSIFCCKELLDLCDEDLRFSSKSFGGEILKTYHFAVQEEIQLSKSIYAVLTNIQNHLAALDGT